MHKAVNFFLFYFVPDRYKTQEMCDKAVDNYAHALKFVPDQYRTKKMYDEAVDNYSSLIQFVPECNKTNKNV